MDERGRLPLTETSFGLQGAGSPFGEDVALPLSTEDVDYQPRPNTPDRLRVGDPDRHWFVLVHTLADR